METSKKKSTAWQKVKSFLTAGKSKKPTGKVEYFFFYVFLLLLVGDVTFSIAILNYGYQASNAIFPPHGFSAGYPMTFAETGSSFPIIYVAVAANTTSQVG